jgi:hypothetical protein
VLHGSVFGSGPVSLEDGFVQLRFGLQLVERAIVTNRVYQGCLLPEAPEKRLFRSASCSFPQLKAFLNRTGFSTKVLKKRPDFDLRYRRLMPTRIRTDEGLEIKIGSLVKHPLIFASFDQHAAVHEAAYVTFTPATPAEFSFFDACINTLRDFLALASRRVRSPVFVELECAFDRYPTVRLLRKSTYVSDDARPLHPLLDLTFEANVAPGGLGSTLKRWFEAAPGLLPVRNLFVASTANRGFLEDSFLASVQGLETLHRRLRPDQYMCQEKFDADILPSLRNAIPSDLSPAHKDALRARLTYGNEYALRRRLKELSLEHREALEQVFGGFKLIDGDFKEMEEIRSARNYLTHLPPTHDATFDRGGLLRLSEIARTLLEFCLMEVAGFSSTDISMLARTREIYHRR